LKLIIQVDNTDCCLYAEKAMETNVHLIDKCKWTSIVWQEMIQWTGTTLQNAGIIKSLDSIRRKHRKKAKKEIMAAIGGAVLYHTWCARNWKKFKGKQIHTNEVVQLIKKEITERVNLLYNSKKHRIVGSLFNI